MDIDLAEYDQIEEIKFIMEGTNQILCDGASSKFLVTLSSCSEQGSLEETNCENDYVFLPALSNPPRATTSLPTSPSANSKLVSPTINANRSQMNQYQECNRKHDLAQKEDENTTNKLSQSDNHSLNALCNYGSNPFQLYAAPTGQYHQPQIATGKPTGLLGGCGTTNDPKRLTDLMQQIVTRSEMIHIAIQCIFCQQSIACPPCDLTSWLNHMNYQHNCKVCPICNKLIGLGPRRDVEIMRSHVSEHPDIDWLERRDDRASFTFGLQQQWFSSGKCTIRDLRHR